MTLFDAELLGGAKDAVRILSCETCDETISIQLYNRSHSNHSHSQGLPRGDVSIWGFVPPPKNHKKTLNSRKLQKHL